jgi:SP family sugar:H+ symporter-like MFS transporter
MTEASPQRANMGFIGAIVAVATIGGFLFGYDSGAVNGTQDGLKQAFGLIDGSWSPTNGLGFTVASLLIGCFIGAFFAGRLADLIGRRNTMILAAACSSGGRWCKGLPGRSWCSCSPESAGEWRSGRRASSRPPTSPKLLRRTSAAD